ncbi:MAG: permease [Armatimonadota bacterium]
MKVAAYVILGFVAGALSGVLGIGGGVIIVPALVFLFHMSQHQTQGTTLAMLIPPIGILAAYTYYRAGYVQVIPAALLAAGFFFGGLIGAKIATHLSNAVLVRIFGVAMLLIALKMIFGKP